MNIRILVIWLIVVLASMPMNSVAAQHTNLSPWDMCAEPLARYAQGPAGPTVFPTRIESTTSGAGTIERADAILVRDQDAATLTLPGGESPILVVDFGQVVTGNLSVHALAGSSATLRIATSESLRFLGPHADTDWGGQGAAIWTPPTSAATFDTGQRTFRYVHLSLDTPGSIAIDALSLAFSAFVGTPETYAGCFDSSDDLINRIWYAGAYTLELNTVSTSDGHTTIIDGAKRDRLAWTADLAVQAEIAGITHADSAAVRYALADLAAHQRPDGAIPPSPYDNYGLVFYDYCAWWIIALADDYTRTGDLTFAESLYAQLSRQVAWFHTVPHDGALLVKDAGLEWSYTLNRTGTLAYLNVLYARALRDAAMLASALGHTDDAGTWTSRANAVETSLNERLFDPSRGVYVDSTLDREHVPQDANALAVAFGIAPAEWRPGILSFLREQHWTPSGSTTVAPAYGSNTWHDRRIWPFIGYFELLARFGSGDDAGAWELLRREWGTMLERDPRSTTWEWMTADGDIEDGSTSLAHGWSAGATAALSAYALGVRATSPGYATFSIDPRPADLAWARGRVPTPHGPVDVSWWNLGDGFALSAVVPPGASATVSIPISNSSDTLLVNGDAAWADAHSLTNNARLFGDRVVVDLDAGDYQLVTSSTTLFVSETSHHLSAPFLSYWTANGGIPVFGYPLTDIREELNDDTGQSYLVQYVERQRFEYHPEYAGTPYAVLLGRLGVSEAQRLRLLQTEPFQPRAGPPSDPDCAWFAPTGHSLCGGFLEYWRGHGLEFGDPGISEREALALFGFPISEPFIDPTSGLSVQFFERARFEHHPEYAGTQWEILLGLLGVTAIENPAPCCALSPPR